MVQNETQHVQPVLGRAQTICSSPWLELHYSLTLVPFMCVWGFAHKQNLMHIAVLESLHARCSRFTIYLPFDLFFALTVLKLHTTHTDMHNPHGDIYKLFH